MVNSCFHFAFCFSPPAISNDAGEGELVPACQEANHAGTGHAAGMSPRDGDDATCHHPTSRRCPPPASWAAGGCTTTTRHRRIHTGKPGPFFFEDYQQKGQSGAHFLLLI